MTPGRETSEWTVMKWVTTVAGIVGTALTTLTAALVGSGALVADSPAVLVLGGIAAVALALAGKVGGDYIKARGHAKAGSGDGS